MDNIEFKIEDNLIKFIPKINEVDTIIAARDFIQKKYFEEIRKGKIIFFNNWDINKGFIEFNIR